MRLTEEVFLWNDEARTRVRVDSYIIDIIRGTTDMVSNDEIIYIGELDWSNIEQGDLIVDAVETTVFRII